MIKLQHMDNSDKQWLIGAIVAPIAAWWIFKGRQKYGSKGLK